VRITGTAAVCGRPYRVCGAAAQTMRRERARAAEAVQTAAAVSRWALLPQTRTMRAQKRIAAFSSF